MLDKNFVRDNLEFVRERLATRGGDYPLEELVAKDKEWKSIIRQSEELRRARNEESEAIGKLKRAGKDTSEQQAKVKEISNEIRSLEETAGVIEKRLNSFLHNLPNLPDSSVPIGSSEDENVEVRRWGTQPVFDFNPLDHVDLGSSLGILDMERASKITGARFALLCKTGALMERALISFMLDVHTKNHGYQEVLPPFMVNSGSLFGTGNLPKFAEDLFKI
jgi:seryl-tRNA synthetase